MKNRLDTNRLLSYYYDLNSKDKLSKPEKRLLDKLTLEINKTLPEQIDDGKTKFTKYISPLYLHKFLLAYNQDPLLSNTCHDIDDEDRLKDVLNLLGENQFTVEKFVSYASLRVNSLYKKYKVITFRVKTLISVYLTGKNFFGEKAELWGRTYETNWSSGSLVKWAEDNTGLVPNPGRGLKNKYRYRGFEINPVTSRLHNKKIINFNLLVWEFKNQIHIRHENSIKKLFEIRKEYYKDWDKKITFDLSGIDESIELFTHVDSLISGLSKIIEIIIEYIDKNGTKNNKVKIDFRKSSDGVWLSIKHMRSIIKKRPDDFLERIGNSHRGLIKHNINGVCDLYLEGDYESGGSFSLNLWNNKEIVKVKIPKVNGVTHILKFYK